MGTKTEITISILLDFAYDIFRNTTWKESSFEIKKFGDKYQLMCKNIRGEIEKLEFGKTPRIHMKDELVELSPKLSKEDLYIFLWGMNKFSNLKIEEK